MVAMTPLITIQVLGFVYKYKLQRATDVTPTEEEILTDEVIDYTQTAIWPKHLLVLAATVCRSRRRFRQMEMKTLSC